jgi:hypothetical protein
VPRVGGQADEKSDLFGLMPALGVLQIGRSDECLDRVEQTEDLLAAEMEPGPRTHRTAHAAQRIDVDDALDVRPPDGRAQHAEAPRDHGHRRARRAPRRHGRPHVLGLERRHTAHGEWVRTQGLDVGARPDPRRRPPVVVSAEPALEQLADGEERGCTTVDPPFCPLAGQLLAPELGVFHTPVEGEGTLHRAPRDRVDSYGDAYLPVAGTALAHGAVAPRHAPKSRDECRDTARFPGSRSYPFVASTLDLRGARSEGFEPPTF